MECTVYCWRCGRFVHGLSESEYAQFETAFALMKRALNEALDRGELDNARSAELMKPLAKLAEELSGEVGLEPSHLFKHRASEFGPPCQGCGRNLRTKRASMCLVCGRDKGNHS